MVNNKVGLARMYKMSPARVTQIMNLFKLPRVIWAQVLQMPKDQQKFFSEKKLRKIVRLKNVSKQIEAFNVLKSSFDS
jgi:hypothetical protein